MEIELKKLNRSQIIILFDITGETIDNWTDAGCPFAYENGIKIYSPAEVFKWRLEREKKKIKKAKENVPEGQMNMDEIKRLVEFENLRKKKLENDLTESIRTDKATADRLFFELGKGIKQKMLNMAPSISSLLHGLTIFEIETKLRKEIEKNLNEFAEEVK